MLNTTYAPAIISQSALSELFRRYVAGQLNENALGELMDAIDTSETSPEEREALAEFYNDALHLGLDAIQIPKQEELRELLSVTHA